MKDNNYTSSSRIGLFPEMELFSATNKTLWEIIKNVLMVMIIYGFHYF